MKAKEEAMATEAEVTAKEEGEAKEAAPEREKGAETVAAVEKRKRTARPARRWQRSGTGPRSDRSQSPLSAPPASD